MYKRTSLLLAALALTSTLSFAQEQDGEDNNYEIVHIQKLPNEVYQLVYNPTDNNVYVAGPKKGFNRDTENFIYVLNGNDLQITDSITVGKNLPFGIALNNKTQTLYVGHSMQNAVSALDLKTKKQTLIPGGKEKGKIRELVADERSNTVYVSDHGVPSIWQIDGKTNTYLRSFEKPGAYLIGLGVDSEREKVYGTDGQDMKGNILVFDTKTGKLENSFKTWSYCPLNIALDLTQNRIFVSQSNDNNITVLNGETGEIIDKVYLGFNSSPIGLVYDASNNLIYTANRVKQEVAVVDATTYKVIDRIPTDGLPNTISLDPKTGMIYVTNKEANRNAEPLENGNTVIKIRYKKG
ncbi:YncE family protein [Sphingobacterium deserti]|uniref:40-residue YVTN family beta-propeller repeat protein n=1 Tax=Sphingobacterium deserti TaxID=1229276 RepID=A0A0B8T234_9SPHI|nr:YncE family protein [Sphingobacterium deserti]KGE12828.1 40-residue YVTN family beta-propeller repeat protein [Sphingobacterium deserti]